MAQIIFGFGSVLEFTNEMLKTLQSFLGHFLFAKMKFHVFAFVSGFVTKGLTASIERCNSTLCFAN
jgi:hypothetical protein